MWPCRVRGPGLHPTQMETLDLSLDMSQHKSTLQDLNSRLSCFIQQVGCLEAANQALEQQIEAELQRKSPVELKHLDSYLKSASCIQEQIELRAWEVAVLKLQFLGAELSVFDLRSRCEQEGADRDRVEAGLTGLLQRGAELEEQVTRLDQEASEKEEELQLLQRQHQEDVRDLRGRSAGVSIEVRNRTQEPDLAQQLQNASWSGLSLLPLLDWSHTAPQVGACLPAALQEEESELLELESVAADLQRLLEQLLSENLGLESDAVQHMEMVEERLQLFSLDAERLCDELQTVLDASENQAQLSETLHQTITELRAELQRYQGLLRESELRVSSSSPAPTSFKARFVPFTQTLTSGAKGQRAAWAGPARAGRSVHKQSGFTANITQNQRRDTSFSATKLTPEAKPSTLRSESKGVSSGAAKESDGQRAKVGTSVTKVESFDKTQAAKSSAPREINGEVEKPSVVRSERASKESKELLQKAKVQADVTGGGSLDDTLQAKGREKAVHEAKDHIITSERSVRAESPARFNGNLDKPSTLKAESKLVTSEAAKESQNRKDEASAPRVSGVDKTQEARNTTLDINFHLKVGKVNGGVDKPSAVGSERGLTAKESKVLLQKAKVQADVTGVCSFNNTLQAKGSEKAVHEAKDFISTSVQDESPARINGNLDKPSTLQAESKIVASDAAKALQNRKDEASTPRVSDVDTAPDINLHVKVGKVNGEVNKPSTLKAESKLVTSESAKESQNRKDEASALRVSGLNKTQEARNTAPEISLPLKVGKVNGEVEKPSTVKAESKAASSGDAKESHRELQNGKDKATVEGVCSVGKMQEVRNATQATSQKAQVETAGKAASSDVKKLQDAKAEANIPKVSRSDELKEVRSAARVETKSKTLSSEEEQARCAKIEGSVSETGSFGALQKDPSSTAQRGISDNLQGETTKQIQGDVGPAVLREGNKKVRSEDGLATKVQKVETKGDEEQEAKRVLTHETAGITPEEIAGVEHLDKGVEVGAATDVLKKDPVFHEEVSLTKTVPESQTVTDLGEKGAETFQLEARLDAGPVAGKHSAETEQILTKTEFEIQNKDKMADKEIIAQAPQTIIPNTRQELETSQQDLSPSLMQQKDVNAKPEFQKGLESSLQQSPAHTRTTRTDKMIIVKIIEEIEDSVSETSAEPQQDQVVWGSEFSVQRAPENQEIQPDLSGGVRASTGEDVCAKPGEELSLYGQDLQTKAQILAAEGSKSCPKPAAADPKAENGLVVGKITEEMQEKTSTAYVNLPDVNSKAEFENFEAGNLQGMSPKSTTAVGESVSKTINPVDEDFTEGEDVLSAKRCVQIDDAQQGLSERVIGNGGEGEQDMKAKAQNVHVEIGSDIQPEQTSAESRASPSENAVGDSKIAEGIEECVSKAKADLSVKQDAKTGGDLTLPGPDFQAKEQSLGIKDKSESSTKPTSAESGIIGAESSIGDSKLANDRESDQKAAEKLAVIVGLEIGDSAAKEEQDLSKIHPENVIVGAAKDAEVGQSQTKIDKDNLPSKVQDSPVNCVEMSKPELRLATEKQEAMSGQAAKDQSAKTDKTVAEKSSEISTKVTVTEAKTKQKSLDSAPQKMPKEEIEISQHFGTTNEDKAEMPQNVASLALSDVENCEMGVKIPMEKGRISTAFSDSEVPRLRLAQPGLEFQPNPEEEEEFLCLGEDAFCPQDLEEFCETDERMDLDEDLTEANVRVRPVERYVLKESPPFGDDLEDLEEAEAIRESFGTFGSVEREVTIRSSVAGSLQRTIAEKEKETGFGGLYRVKETGKLITKGLRERSGTDEQVGVESTGLEGIPSGDFEVREGRVDGEGNGKVGQTEERFGRSDVNSWISGSVEKDKLQKDRKVSEMPCEGAEQMLENGSIADVKNEASPERAVATEKAKREKSANVDVPKSEGSLDVPLSPPTSGKEGSEWRVYGRSSGRMSTSPPKNISPRSPLSPLNTGGSRFSLSPTETGRFGKAGSGEWMVYGQNRDRVSQSATEIRALSPTARPMSPVLSPTETGRFGKAGSGEWLVYGNRDRVSQSATEIRALSPTAKPTSPVPRAVSPTDMGRFGKASSGEWKFYGNRDRVSQSAAEIRALSPNARPTSPVLSPTSPTETGRFGKAGSGEWMVYVNRDRISRPGKEFQADFRPQALSPTSPTETGRFGKAGSGEWMVYGQNRDRVSQSATEIRALSPTARPMSPVLSPTSPTEMGRFGKAGSGEWLVYGHNRDRMSQPQNDELDFRAMSPEEMVKSGLYFTDFSPDNPTPELGQFHLSPRPLSPPPVGPYGRFGKADSGEWRVYGNSSTTGRVSKAASDERLSAHHSPRTMSPVGPGEAAHRPLSPEGGRFGSAREWMVHRSLSLPKAETGGGALDSRQRNLSPPAVGRLVEIGKKKWLGGGSKDAEKLRKRTLSPPEVQRKQVLTRGDGRKSGRNIISSLGKLVRGKGSKEPGGGAGGRVITSSDGPIRSSDSGTGAKKERVSVCKMTAMSMSKERSQEKKSSRDTAPPPSIQHWLSTSEPRPAQDSSSSKP